MKCLLKFPPETRRLQGYEIFNTHIGPHAGYSKRWNWRDDRKRR